MNTIYLVDGKPHRICDCPKLEGKCPRGVERSLQTTQLSQCFVPAPDVLIAGSAVPEAARSGWIPVGEKLPANTHLVLIAYLPAYHKSTKGHRKRSWSTTFARYSGGAWRFVVPNQKSRLTERVKFWQPLPDEPASVPSPLVAFDEMAEISQKAWDSLATCQKCGSGNRLNGRIVHGPSCPAREPQGESNE